MVKNSNLSSAKKQKNDEFYTQYSDISNEMGHYRQHFKGKTIYCNCDDPTQSNFWRYFHNNFTSLGLKKLISTHYEKGQDPSYMITYEGGDDFHMEVGKKTTIYGNDGYTAGDFRSKACEEVLDTPNLIVITNPPFSLLREYVATILKHNKQFLIIGNKNAVTYKEIFPLIKENKIWFGYTSPNIFDTPDGMTEKVNGLSRWFTNLDITKRHDGLWHKDGKFDDTQAHCYYEGWEEHYPKYDNYDAINVDKTKEIPIDYKGVMGVPITWLDKYNPEEFEIITMTKTPIGNEYRTTLYDRQVQHNANGNTCSVTKLNDGAALIHGSIPNKFPYYETASHQYFTAVYPRVLIRNLHPISKADDK